MSADADANNTRTGSSPTPQNEPIENTGSKLGATGNDRDRCSPLRRSQPFAVAVAFVLVQSTRSTNSLTNDGGQELGRLSGNKLRRLKQSNTSDI